MPWYVKRGAMYQTKNGDWTWSRNRARAHDSKGGKLDAGMYWSREDGNNTGRKSEAAKREEERAAILP
jgi:hypothetical protein